MTINSETLRRFALAGVVTGFLAFGAACNDDDDIVEPPPPPPAQGVVTAQVTDDPATPTDPDAEPATYTGTLTGQGQVQLSADGVEWVDVGTQQNVQVGLQTDDRATLHQQVSVASSDYTHIRLVMSNVEVLLDAGSTVGESTLEEDVTLQVAAGEQVTFESQLTTPLQVAEGTQSTVVFDLNSELWITEAALQAEQVAAGDFGGAVDVDVDGEATGG